MGDDPTEHVQEHIQHTAAHGDEHDAHGHGGGHAGGHASKWITAAALTAAFLAAFAAVSGALSNSHLTESTHMRIDANDQWSYYQSKSIKSSNIDTRIYVAKLFKVPPSGKDVAKRTEYEEQLPEIQKEADKLVAVSDRHVQTHETYETAETIFHIAIAIVAIAVVAKRKEFWFVSIVTGAIGVGFFGWAFANAPPGEPKKEAPPAATAPEKPGEKKPAGEKESKEHPTSQSHEAPAHESAPAAEPAAE